MPPAQSYTMTGAALRTILGEATQLEKSVSP
jgi:hypothetical protein